MLKQAMKDNHPMVKAAAALVPIDPKPVVYDGSKVADDEVVSMEASGLHVEVVPVTTGMPVEFRPVKMLSAEEIKRIYPNGPLAPAANGVNEFSYGHDGSQIAGTQQAGNAAIAN